MYRPLKATRQMGSFTILYKLPLLSYRVNFSLYCLPFQTNAPVMTKCYIFLLLIFSLTRSYSQLSVTATAGTTGPTAYATLKTVFDAINSGTHQGSVTITINGTTTETVSAVLNASGAGSASYTAISLQPTGGVASTISGNIAGALIDLNGADNITINGLNAAGNSLTISNTGNTPGAATIRFINDASNNNIQNTTILGAGTSITTGTIVFSTGTATGNDNNTINNCTIADAAPGFPVNAICSLGTAGQENSNNTISNNNISNYFNADLATTGILIAAGNTDWNITTNKFFQAAARTFTTANTHRVIQVSSGNNYTINGNVIGYSSAAATGTYTLAGAVATKFAGIELSVGTGTASSVNNNTIAAISLTTTSNASATTIYGVWCGIYIIAGNVNVGAGTNNIIGSTAGNSSVVVSPTVNGAYVVAIASSSTGIVTINDNKIGGIDLVPSGANAGTLVGISTSGAGGNTTIMGNIIGNTLAGNMRIGTAGVTTQGGIARGIINTNSGTVDVKLNTIRNLVNNGTASTALFRGIESQAGSGMIFGNNLNNISAGGTIASFSTQAGIGILISSTATGIAVDSNTISNLALTNAGTTGAVISGIYAGIPSASSGIVNGLAITRNRIYNLSNANVASSTTAPATIAGIYCGNANAANPMLINNNMISLGSAQGTNSAVIGIFSHYATAQNYTAKIYHNTVNITGTVSSGAQPSFCYYRGDFSATSSSVPTVELINNLFTNSRSGGTGKHYAIANGYPNAVSSATGWAATASDYNILNSTETTLGYWNGDQTFNTWQTASGGDAHSFTAMTVNYVNAATDLHLTPSANAQIDNKGTPLAAVTYDLDLEQRSTVTPDVGADEFTSGTFPVSMLYFTAKKQANTNLLSWKMICNATEVVFEIQRSNDGRNFSSLTQFTATKERCAAPFDYTDNTPARGADYYRLRITEPGGKLTYSSIVLLSDKGSAFELTAITPTVVNTSAILSVTSTNNTMLNIRVTDMNGRTVITAIHKIEAGAATIPLDLRMLTKGVYQVTIANEWGDTRTARIIKM